MPTVKALASALLLAGLAPVAHAEPPQLTQPVHSYADAIRETVYVESSIDGDGDGRRDRILADIIRPRTTKKVPVVMGISPYYGGGMGTAIAPTDGRHKEKAADGHPDFFPSVYDNYFVPRGYAVVLADMPGTRYSEGCPDLGGPNEVLGTKAVIDWLGGRAKAFDHTGKPITPEWTTGDVGMYGTSWDGTLANMVATTDVPNLKTIVPTGAISSWYDYLRVNGIERGAGSARELSGGVRSPAAVEKCAEEHAELIRQGDTNFDHSAFWAERNFVEDAHKVKAAVFAIHGLNEVNVTMQQLSKWWQKLKSPRKLWLTQAGHVSAHLIRPNEYMHTVHRWFDHWLMGIDTGITREPAVQIERTPHVWEDAPSWPARTTPKWLHLNDLATTAQRFTDAPGLTQHQLAGDEGAGHRLLYLTPPLTKDTRMSGTPSITLRASANVPNTPLTAFVVDFGPGTHVDNGPSTYGKGMQRVDGEHCYGAGHGVDTGCYPKQDFVTTTTPHRIVTRGAMDAAHRYSLNFAVPLTPGRTETFRWELEPHDHVFKAGHRIGIMIAANNGMEYESYEPPKPSGEITVVPRGSSVFLPLVR